MSKILRRPMFRGGGKVSSYGNGIATGLADGGMPGKRGLVDGPGGYAGEFKTGSQVFKEAPGIFGLKFDNPFLSMKTPANRVGGVKFDLGQSPSDFAKALSEGSPYRDYLTSSEEFETETTESGDVKFKLDENGDRIPIESDKGSLAELIEKQRIEDITMQDPQGELGDTGTVTGGANIAGIVEEPSTVNSNLPGEPENSEEPEINVRDLIQTNADMFNEMLSAGTKERNEKRLKKARIQDISDVGLDIYARSTKPGADVKTMLGGAAERMVNKPSRTEKLIDKQMDQEDKTKMQATALAINDFIAGKRSDEAIEKLIAQSGLSLANQQKLYNYKASLESGIKKSKSVTTLMGEDKSNDRTIQKIRKNSKVFAENNGLDMPTSIITKETKGSELPIVLDTKTLLVEENKNQVFIDETTKEVFQVIEDPNGDGYIKKRLY